MLGLGLGCNMDKGGTTPGRPGLPGARTREGFKFRSCGSWNLEKHASDPKPRFPWIRIDVGKSVAETKCRSQEGSGG